MSIIPSFVEDAAREATELYFPRRKLSQKEAERYNTMLRNVIAHAVVHVPEKNRKRDSIFVSHSRRDLDKLVKPVAKRIRWAGFDAYIASLRVTGKNPAEKIVGAIASSKALFAIITPHVTEDRDTRDWVLFEMGVAKSLGKSVYGWKTPRATVPEPVKQITDYIEFDANNTKEIKRMLQMVGSLAKNLPRN